MRVLLSSRQQQQKQSSSSQLSTVTSTSDTKYADQSNTDQKSFVESHSSSTVSNVDILGSIPIQVFPTFDSNNNIVEVTSVSSKPIANSNTKVKDKSLTEKSTALALVEDSDSFVSDISTFSNNKNSVTTNLRSFKSPQTSSQDAQSIHPSSKSIPKHSTTSVAVELESNLSNDIRKRKGFPLRKSSPACGGNSVTESVVVTEALQGGDSIVKLIKKAKHSFGAPVVAKDTIALQEQDISTRKTKQIEAGYKIKKTDLPNTCVSSPSHTSYQSNNPCLVSDELPGLSKKKGTKSKINSKSAQMRYMHDTNNLNWDEEDQDHPMTYIIHNEDINVDNNFTYENPPNDPLDYGTNCNNKCVRNVETKIGGGDGDNEYDRPEQGPRKLLSHVVIKPSSSSSSKQESNNQIGKERNKSFSVQQQTQQQLHTRFQTELKKKGMELVEQEGDGNCLFRAISLQIYGDSDLHMDVRKRCLDFMEKEETHFSSFVVEEPFDEYVNRKRLDGVHGNNPEIQALSELYNRPVEVYVPNNKAVPINIFHKEYKTCDVPIRLSYHDGNHYNAIIDPLMPTAGLGLGLPGLEPGLADKLQVQKAVKESDELHVKKVAEDSHKMEVQHAIQESRRSMDYMYRKKTLALSDLEATDFELEQIALASSLESYRNIEQSQKQPWSFGQNQRERRRHRSGNVSPCSSSRLLVPRSSQPQQQKQQETHTDFPSSVSQTAIQPAFGREIESNLHSSNSASIPTVATLSSEAFVGNYEQSRVSNFLNDDIPLPLLNDGNHHQDEYPQVVQELVMNGFELTKVLRAYELIGDSFDNLLAYLMSIGS